MAGIPSTPKAKRLIWAPAKVRRLSWSKLRSNEHELDLRGHVTTVTNAENRFLENMPGDIKEVLHWYAGGQSCARASESMAEFAGRFLGGMHEDGAVVPTNLSASAPEVLALTVLQHKTSPLSAGAWLNLGFALRRAALYRSNDPEEINRARLQSAVQAFDRALTLDPDNHGKNSRAW